MKLPLSQQSWSYVCWRRRSSLSLSHFSFNTCVWRDACVERPKSVPSTRRLTRKAVVVVVFRQSIITIASVVSIAWLKVTKTETKWEGMISRQMMKKKKISLLGKRSSIGSNAKLVWGKRNLIREWRILWTSYCCSIVSFTCKGLCKWERQLLSSLVLSSGHVWSIVLNLETISFYEMPW